MSNYEKFYVYVYLDPRKKGNFVYGKYIFNFEPFYVGKGMGDRYKKHLKESYNYKDTNKHKCNIIRKIKKELNIEPIIIKYNDYLEEDAVQIEKELIKNIGRFDLKKGPLTNLTDGGDGFSGYKWTKERIDKLRIETIFRNIEFIEKYVKNNNNNENPKNLIKYNKSKIGKTLEEIHGIRKANKIKKKLSNNIKGHKKPKSYVDKLVKRCSKKWKIIYPNGEEEIIINLSKYCRENKLDQGAMIKVSQGKKNHYKKYKCLKLEK